MSEYQVEFSVSEGSGWVIWPKFQVNGPPSTILVVGKLCIFLCAAHVV